MSAQLLSILSAGHSGSTLLDLVVGTIPGTFSAGEVTYLPWQIYRRGENDPTAIRQDVCTCFKSFRECTVWRDVIERLGAEVGFDIFEDPFRFRVALLAAQRYRRQPKKRLLAARVGYGVTSRVRAIDRLWFWRLRRAVENNWLLFDTICATQNVNMVIDSTKDRLRFRLLHQGRPDAVRAILLARDPRGVAYSAQKRNEDPLRMVESWRRYYAQAVCMLQRIPNLRVLRVQYEELCGDPIRTRRQVAAFLDLPDPGPTLHDQSLGPHLIAGNPMRYRWTGEVRLDNAWKHEFTGEPRRKVDAIHAQLGEGWPALSTSR